MTPVRIVHTCMYAKGNAGKDAYICEKTGCNCTAQFFCHNDNYWKPSYQIKCKDFSEGQEQKVNDEQKDQQN